MQGELKKCVHLPFISETLKGNDNLENLGVEGRIILKCT